MSSECHLDGRRYTDQSFDQEFFTVLQRASLQCIHTAGSATLDDIATYLRDKVNDSIVLPHLLHSCCYMCVTTFDTMCWSYARRAAEARGGRSGYQRWS